MSTENDINHLKALLSEKEQEVNHLKALLSEKEKDANVLKVQLNEINSVTNTNSENNSVLSQSEILRYSRQLILPEFGLSGQLALKQTSVLIVGAGGLGCPVGLYLAAAGVGRIGIVDHDVVDVSNLHRQVAHRMKFLEQKKSFSLQQAIYEINPSISCQEYPILLNSSNAEDIIKSYNIIVDASDNVPTRYLLNDAAVLFDKPLISGSALKFEGQLTVYNYLDGPCYRCLFPVPPSSNVVGNCSDSGVLGVVTGIIGCHQALEVIKIAIGIHPTYFKKMLLFDGLNGDMRTVKLRSKKIDCDVCGNNPSIKKLIDYDMFCQQSATDKVSEIDILPDSERISCSEYKKILDIGTPHLLLDVRPSHEMDICCLPNSVNIPISELTEDDCLQKIKKLLDEKSYQTNFVICKRGNDSQTAVIALKKLLQNWEWKDVKGGLIAWHKEIDLSFPLYCS